MTPIIFHIDVNSAYLSWTAIDKLHQGAEIDLREIPAIIGGNQQSRHGVVLAKSIPAKKYGIRTGEPVANAFRKCPNLLMEPPNHRMYEEYSDKLMQFLKEFTPDIEQVSVDECFMEFTGIAHHYNSPAEAAALIKNAVQERLGFTVNIGISNNKLLAKMASDFQKPNMVHTLFPEEIPKKMWPLPVSELYMAGRSSVVKLHTLEVNTIGELARMDVSILKMHLKSHGQMLWEFANGIDKAIVRSDKIENKGIGNSTTLSEDVVTVEEAGKVLRILAESVAGRLRSAGQKANSISVEIKYNTFQTASHQCMLTRPSNTNEMIYKTACELFRELWNGTPVRLLGIRSSKLTDEKEPEQLSLFDMPMTGADKEIYQKTDEKHEKLDKAMDDIRKKFGQDAIIRGSSMLEK